MKFKLKNDKKLTARDFISIGVFNALAIIIYMIISSLFCMTIIGSFFSNAAVFLVIGVIYVLLAIKIQKRGVFLISGLIFGLISLASGHVYHFIAIVIGGAIAEILAGKYDSSRKISLAYVAFALSDFLGIDLPIFAFGSSYILEKASNFGISENAINSSIQYFTWSTFFVLLILNVICAIIGAWIGMIIIEKHFKKSGLIE